MGDVRSVLPDYDGREVKTIGDAAMLVEPEAAKAVPLGLRLARKVGGRHGLPSVRVGMHPGAAVERNGDWYGAAVNLAARVSGLAGADQVLITEDTRELAEPLQGVELRSLGPQSFRNVGRPITVYEVTSVEASADRLPIDPVCRMAVEPRHQAGRLVHDGTQYHFCSLECAGQFAHAPDSYVEQSERARRATNP